MPSARESSSGEPRADARRRLIPCSAHDASSPPLLPMTTPKSEKISALTPRSCWRAVGRVFLGESPRALLWLFAPTAMAFAIDLVIRARSIVGFAPQGKAIYGSSLLISAAFWGLPLWLAARLFRGLRGARSRLAAAGLAALTLGWLFPFATFAFGGQALYYRVFHAYIGRDTVRLGIALRGTVRDWFVAWGSPLLLGAVLVAGALLTFAMAAIARRQSSRLNGVPVLPFLTFAGAAICFWTDNVDSRFLQAATPDACFVHGATHALRVAVTGKGDLHQGMSLRTPAPLPPLTSSRPRPPNVLVVLTESVRADALCSDPPPACRAPFLDEVVPERIGLGKLTSQTPNTFSAFLLLTTGLAPNVDFRSAHTAPVLWELARAVGYRTAYVTSQNPNYEDFGAFVRRAGIDDLVTATELGGLGQEQLGAPDERAADEMLRFIRAVPVEAPYFGVLHLSNTHAPYRSDPALVPFSPESDDPLGNIDAFHNHYRNSVRMQERMVAGLLRDIRALPSWDDTVVLFLSDHGEQFREHGGLYHNHSLFDEELRIPGWLASGARALGEAERAALRTYASSRTFMVDVHATLVDLFGLDAARGALPLGALVGGRSLLVPRDGAEPSALLATSTAVWEPDNVWHGVMRGEKLLAGTPSGAWTCFDLLRDPAERRALPAASCGTSLALAMQAFAAP